VVSYIGSLYWFVILVRYIGSLYWFDILVRYIGSLYWFDILVRYIGSLYWFVILVRYFGSLYWFVILVGRSVGLLVDAHFVKVLLKTVLHLIARCVLWAVVCAFEEQRICCACSRYVFCISV
jgi:hypothetical protein